MAFKHTTLGFSLLPRARPTECQPNWFAQSRECQKERHGKENVTFRLILLA